MSIGKNPQALALAFKKTQGKLLKIKELGITPEIDAESTELLIESLAEAKAAADGVEFNTVVKGQRWYVENLVAFSALELEDQFEAEYADSFADTASEDEMMVALRKIAA